MADVSLRPRCYPLNYGNVWYGSGRGHLETSAFAGQDQDHRESRRVYAFGRMDLSDIEGPWTPFRPKTDASILPKF